MWLKIWYNTDIKRCKTYRQTREERDDARLTFVDEIKDEDGGSAGPAQSPSDAEFLRRRLSAAFAKLPPVLRDAYTLFQVAELPIHEIARQTGVSENLVKVRIFRAKQKLQEILSDLRGA